MPLLDTLYEMMKTFAYSPFGETGHFTKAFCISALLKVEGTNCTLYRLLVGPETVYEIQKTTHLLPTKLPVTDLNLLYSRKSHAP